MSLLTQRCFWRRISHSGQLSISVLSCLLSCTLVLRDRYFVVILQKKTKEKFLYKEYYICIPLGSMCKLLQLLWLCRGVFSRTFSGFLFDHAEYNFILWIVAKSPLFWPVFEVFLWQIFSKQSDLKKVPFFHKMLVV